LRTLSKRPQIAVAAQAIRKLTLRSPAIERHIEPDPYDDGAADLFGELCDFWNGKRVTVHRSFSAAVSAGRDHGEIAKPDRSQS